uniref:Peptidase M13 C-terminal domain-containing protein n=1 Tax=Spongospora subterranea TaxID=70186 RepID=A0A0H5R7D3_9EUKA|eukprot:CRZ09667.1 hypothetical protein [Spongospora subterranea]
MGDRSPASQRRKFNFDAQSSELPGREDQYLLPVEDEEFDYRSDIANQYAGYRNRPLNILNMHTLYVFLVMMACLALLVFVIKYDPNKEESPVSNIDRSFSDEVKMAMNMSVDPCEDFYQYSCGGWIANAVIPGDKDSYAKSFTTLSDRNLEILHEIVQGSKNDRLSSLYLSCMDADTIERNGMSPLRKELNGLDAVATIPQLFTLIGDMEKRHAGFFFDISVDVDAKDTNQYLISIGQSGLSMGDRYLYLDPVLAHVAGFREHVQSMFDLASIQPFQQNVSLSQAIDNIVNFEVAVAEFTKPPEALRDPEAVYNMRPIANCTSEFGFDFLHYLKQMGFEDANDQVRVNAINPDFIHAMGQLIGATPISVVKDVVCFHILNSMAQVLPAPIRNENFRFFSTELRGVKTQPDRWKTCLKAVDRYLGDDLGQKFLSASKFTEKEKNLAITIATSVIDEFKESLGHISWMDKPTRKLAIQKLEQIKVLMGYPKHWIDYGALHLDNGQFAENVLRSRQFLHEEAIQRMSHPVDPYRFLMTTPTVNAYYEPTLNSINFPAGILQHPFFTSAATVPRAMNYGGIGTVIGHELVHGFDDEGRKYDGKGILHQWWPDEVSQRFNERAEWLGQQYASFPYSERSINPKLTMGENIADNGGVAAAFKAFIKASAEEPDQELWPGFDNKKLFFVAMAQNWCVRVTPERAALSLKTDPHSPASARVSVPLINSPEFAETFQCPVGATLNPENKCIIW